MISWTTSLLEYYHRMDQSSDESPDHLIQLAHEAENECKDLCRFLHDLLVEKDSSNESDENFLDVIQEQALEIEIALYRLSTNYSKQGVEEFQNHLINFVRLINNRVSALLDE